MTQIASNLPIGHQKNRRAVRGDCPPRRWGSDPPTVSYVEYDVTHGGRVSCTDTKPAISEKCPIFNVLVSEVEYSSSELPVACFG